jgi:ketosteroid isomerase-like protein
MRLQLTFLLLVFAALGCSDGGKTTVNPEPAAPGITYATEGAEIETVKKVFRNFSTNWDTLRNCFADNALIYDNVWMADTSFKGAPIDVVLEAERKDIDSRYANCTITDAILRSEKHPDGTVYVFSISRFRGTHKETGKLVDVPLAHRFRFCDGKICEEWVIWDSKTYL